MLSPHNKLFQKMKRGLELAPLPHFADNFWRKMLFLCSINWSNFMVWLFLLCELLGNMCIGIVGKPGCDVMNFEVNLIFLIKLLFLAWQKCCIRTKISWEQKKLLRWKKIFFIIFQDLSIKSITQIFSGESPTLNKEFVFPDPEPPTVNILYQDDQVFVANLDYVILDHQS